jgi:methylated-DNA-protein-cysteine methyltransferase-like protein
MRAKRNESADEFSFSQRVKNVIRKVPEGRVATYGQIATLAGNPRAARQVVRILHSSSEKDKLPWHRIVNRRGRIALKPGYGYEIQRELLRQEGIGFGKDDTISFDRYLWSPSWDV